MLSPSSEPSGEATERLMPMKGSSSVSLWLATPGASAMRAAHAYLEGTFESPGQAAEAYGCQRQLVYYYVRKMANAGVTRSKSASSEVRELEFDRSEERSMPSSSAPDPVSNVCIVLASQRAAIPFRAAPQPFLDMC